MITRRTSLFTVVIACVIFGVAPDMRAAGIVAGTTEIPIRAFQDVTLFPGTPFNPTSENIVIERLFGDDIFGLNRQAQVGSTIEASFFGGVFAGSLPQLGDYIFGAVGGLDVSIYATEITNIVQDPADPGFASGDPSSFRSGIYTLKGPQFAFEFLTGPAAGAVLYTAPADFGFESNFDGLPPSPGTLFTSTGPDVLDVLFNGAIVGTSSNRVLMTLPEPTGISFVILCLPAAVALRRRIRKSSSADAFVR